MTEPTARQIADACCDTCRELPGNGPWCCYCGIEVEGEWDFWEHGVFTDWPHDADCEAKAFQDALGE